MDRQQNDVKQMQIKQQEGGHASFVDLVKDFQDRLRHDDSVMTSDISTNMVWMETFFRTLDHMDSNMYRVQQLQFEIANHLACVLEKRYKDKVENERSNV